MDCETLRERLAQDPARADEAFDRHAKICAACEAYRQRLLRAEALIHKALRFDVSAIGAGSAGAGRIVAKRSSWVTVTSSLAAGLILGVVLWSFFGGGAELSPEGLAAEVAEHWYHEPESWVQGDIGVSNAVLENVLGGEAELDLASLRTVTFANLCRVAGDWIAHLVVQGERGPYMVLLFPGRVLQSPVPLELPAEGLRGHILPAGGGSIAVLGGGQPSELEQMETAVVSAVDWTI